MKVGESLKDSAEYYRCVCAAGWLMYSHRLLTCQLCCEVHGCKRSRARRSQLTAVVAPHTPHRVLKTSNGDAVTLASFEGEGREWLPSGPHTQGVLHHKRCHSRSCARLLRVALTHTHNLSTSTATTSHHRQAPGAVLLPQGRHTRVHQGGEGRGRHQQQQQRLQALSR
jgi:hypothetical protein